MQVNEIDNVKPGDRWAFDSDVARVFDNMLERSIPQYPIMRQACFEVASRYVQPDTDIVDLGCSRGEALSGFVSFYGTSGKYLGVDISEPMLEAARERFKDRPENIRIDRCDLRTEYPDCQASVTLAVLTLQFTPIEHRAYIIDQIFKHTAPGGVFIMVEKILGGSAPIDRTLVDCYYDLKRANGYTQDDIDRKRLSLEGVLVPVTARWNEDLLHGAGFRYVESFWRWMNFAGWIAVKE